MSNRKRKIINTKENKLNESDLVTNADKEAEEKIVQTIKHTYPDHSFLTEEDNTIQTQSPFQWIIDPIDGTVNYAHNFPHFCSSIALSYQGQMIVGVVYDPIRKELFHAVKDLGAFLNDVPISTSQTNTLKECLLATGFPYDVASSQTNNMDFFKTFYSKAQAVRRAGSAALDLCYVASGRLDGFWELKLSPWDTAAAALIIQEAGGKVTNFFTIDFDIFKKHIIATNSLIHEDINTILQEVDPDVLSKLP